MLETDLMMRDWVRQRGCTAPSRVTGITAGKIQVLWADGSKHWKDAVYYDPERTTAELLKKNGWRKSGLPYEWQKGIRVQKWRHSDINISFDILETPKYDGFTWKGVDINELHIFQHALRLCGLNDLADNLEMI